MLGIDPERLLAAMSAAPGALIYGAYRLAALWVAGQPPTRADYMKAGMNLAAAIGVGVVSAYFVGPAVAAALPLPALRDLHLVGFVIGVVAWELLPAAIAAARGKIKKAGEGE